MRSTSVVPVRGKPMINIGDAAQGFWAGRGVISLVDVLVDVLVVVLVDLAAANMAAPLSRSYRN